MLAEQLSEAIAAAPTFAAVDNLARITWRGLAEGLFDDAEATRIQAAIDARRAVIQSRGRKIARSSSKPLYDATVAPRRQSSPDKRKSIHRRRQLAASGVIPNRIACHFTQGEQAALTVVAREVKRCGRCTLPLDKIAALAGVCRTTVQNALRHARELRLVHVIERRRSAFRSDTNLVAIISPEWRAWLRLSKERVQKSESHAVTKIYNPCGKHDSFLCAPSVHGIISQLETP